MAPAERRRKSKLDNKDPAGVPLRAYVAMLAWAPLPFASNTAWSSNLLVLLVALCAALWAAYAIGRPHIVRVPFKRFRLFILFALVLVLWFVVQNSTRTPESWHHELWASTADTLGTTVAGAMGLDPAAAYETLARILAYVLAFFLAVQLARRTESALHLSYALAAIAVVYALYGIIVQLTDMNMVAWAEKRAYQDSVTSTFINRNSYGTFAGLGLLVICGLLVRAMRRVAVEGMGGGGLSDTLDRLGFREFFLIGGFVIVGAALILTNSRGATLSTLFALIVFAVLTLLNQRSLRIGTVIAGVIIIVGGWLVFSASSAGLVTRLLDFEQDLIGRREVAEITMRAIAERPWLGFGLGSFEGVFHLYRDGSLSPDLPSFDKAHNTYLEWALEAGIPATLLMVGSIAYFGIACARGALVRRRHANLPAVAAAATTLVAIHSLVDFSLQIPAVTVYFAAILGVGFAQSWSTQHDHEHHTKPQAQGLDAWRSAAEL